MRIKTDALKLPGYRLPTEAEWEYVCRSGAATSRYYGSSTDLLERYAQYYKGVDLRAVPCGSLLPNDLGLSDMLGNVWEWCHDEYRTYSTGGNTRADNDSNMYLSINQDHTRPLRGGSFDIHPPYVRSAIRDGFAPAFRNIDVGFRPSRTYD
jgi:formylglycine-generating enzyme required for sulfatase activity